MASQDSTHLGPPTQARWTWDQLVNEVVEASPVPTRPNSMYVGGNPFSQPTRKIEVAKDGSQDVQSVQKDISLDASQNAQPAQNTTTSSEVKPTSPKQSNFVEAPDHDAEVEHGSESLPTTARTSTIVPKMSEEIMTINRAFSDVGEKEIEINVDLGNVLNKETRLSHTASHSGSSTVNEEIDVVAPSRPDPVHLQVDSKDKAGIEMTDIETGAEAEAAGVDPILEQKWRGLEGEFEHDDVISTIRSTMPGAMVFGDYVIEGSHNGFDTDEDGGFDADAAERNGGFDMGFNQNLVNVFLLWHAFGSTGDDHSRRLMHRHSERTDRQMSDESAGIDHSSPDGGLGLSDE